MAQSRFCFRVVCLLLCFFFAGCSSYPVVPRTYFSKPITQFGFEEIAVGPFIKAFVRQMSPSYSEVRQVHPKSSADELIIQIYIEGDGASWLMNTIPPDNPTPNYAFAASLAALDQNTLVVYLGRPCQFLTQQGLGECSSTNWLAGRFSPDALHITQMAIDQIKRQLGAQRTIHLIGYSGGGVMATLLAAHRTDVRCLVTIAAPLDIKAWTDIQQVAPLTSSMNPSELPSDRQDQLRQVKQHHFWGEQDRIVPIASTLQFQQKYPKAHFKILKQFDHRNNWLAIWPELKQSTCLKN